VGPEIHTSVRSRSSEIPTWGNTDNPCRLTTEAPPNSDKSLLYFHTFQNPRPDFPPMLESKCYMAFLGIRQALWKAVLTEVMQETSQGTSIQKERDLF
jgi:hypothetical protein